MELSPILLAVVILLAVTAACVSLFEHLGFGSVLGFIVAGILIGPHTPGPVVTSHVDELQHIAELGVVLLMFAIGLELRPQKLWQMRRLIFGLGSGQMLLTAAAVGSYSYVFIGHTWQVAVVLGFGFAMSSTAIVMTLLEKKGELAKVHGQGAFGILMAQDLWVVPIMALVPILVASPGDGPKVSLWQEIALVAGALAAVVAVGRYLLPAVLGYMARRRQMETFGVIVLLVVLAAAWVMDELGISMTLGALLIGMTLSSSNFTHQVEAVIEPFKGLLMGLFFTAVGMSIDIAALLEDLPSLLTHLPAILAIKIAILIVLALAFGLGRAAAIRIGGLLSQAGEFAFVLFGTAAALGLMDASVTTLAMLGVAVSMILTPLLVKVTERLATAVSGTPVDNLTGPADELDRHVVVVGFEEIGHLICILLERSGIPYIAVDRDPERIDEARSSGHKAMAGDLASPVTQGACGVARAKAVFVSSADNRRAKSLAITLHGLYPSLNVYVRVQTLGDQDEMRAQGISHAGTSYIESTLLIGGAMIRDLGAPDDDVSRLIEDLRRDDYALVRDHDREHD